VQRATYFSLLTLVFVVAMQFVTCCSDSFTAT
jgi:hypothetical protein